jgi:hypothetical protein
MKSTYPIFASELLGSAQFDVNIVVPLPVVAKCSPSRPRVDDDDERRNHGDRAHNAKNQAGPD